MRGGLSSLWLKKLTADLEFIVIGPQKAGFLALVRKDQEGLNAGDKNGFRFAPGCRAIEERNDTRRIDIDSASEFRILTNYLELTRLFFLAGKKTKRLQKDDLGSSRGREKSCCVFRGHLSFCASSEVLSITSKF